MICWTSESIILLGIAVILCFRMRLRSSMVLDRSARSQALYINVKERKLNHLLVQQHVPVVVDAVEHEQAHVGVLELGFLEKETIRRAAQEEPAQFKKSRGPCERPDCRTATAARCWRRS